MVGLPAHPIELCRLYTEKPRGTTVPAWICLDEVMEMAESESPVMKECVLVSIPNEISGGTYCKGRRKIRVHDW